MTHLSQRDAIDYLCCDVAQAKTDEETSSEVIGADEQTPLLDGGVVEPDETFDDGVISLLDDDQTSFAADFQGLTALEIAAVSDAKKFLSQQTVQRIIDGIWNGDIVFWETISQHSTKEARVYSSKKSDPFCRLRVPLYLKAFEVLFFAAFLAFYYVVLVQKSFDSVTVVEVLLYVWLVSFSYNGESASYSSERPRADNDSRARRVLGCWPDSLRHRLLVILGLRHHRNWTRLLRLPDDRATYGQPGNDRHRFRRALRGSSVPSPKVGWRD